MMVKIPKDEEAAEAVPSPPEWPWDPIIQITVFPGRRIIAHHGRTVFVIISLNNGGLHIFGNLRRRGG